MTVEVRDLLLPEQSLRVLLSDTLSTALKAWHDHWAGSTSIPPSLLLMDHEKLEVGGDGRSWRPDELALQGAVWWSEQADTLPRLAAMLLGRALPLDSASGADDWALDAATQALADLERRCIQALGPTAERDAAIPGQLYTTAPGRKVRDWLRPYTGAVVMDLAALGVRCLMAPQAYAGLRGGAPAPAAASPDLSPLSGLLADRPVRLSLELGAIDVTIDDLTALRQGDVVRFPAQLAVPLSARLLPAGAAPLVGSAAAVQAVLAADLGRLDDRLAIQLALPARAPASPSNSNAQKSALS